MKYAEVELKVNWKINFLKTGYYIIVLKLIKLLWSEFGFQVDEQDFRIIVKTYLASYAVAK
jgi:hypothetical protein